MVKRVNGLYNFNFYFKIIWPPTPTMKLAIKIKICDPPPRRWRGEGACYACFSLPHEWFFKTCFTWYFIRISRIKYQINSFKLNGSFKLLVISKYMVSSILKATNRWKEIKWLAGWRIPDTTVVYITFIS